MQHFCMVIKPTSNLDQLFARWPWLTEVTSAVLDSSTGLRLKGLKGDNNLSYLCCEKWARLTSISLSKCQLSDAVLKPILRVLACQLECINISHNTALKAALGSGALHFPRLRKADFSLCTNLRVDGIVMSPLLSELDLAGISLLRGQLVAISHLSELKKLRLSVSAGGFVLGCFCLLLLIQDKDLRLRRWQYQILFSLMLYVDVLGRRRVFCDF